MGWSSYLPSPIALSLGFWQVHWYGLLLVLGAVGGYLVTRPRWRKAGYPVAELESLVFWLLVGGLVGARLVDVTLFEWGYFQNHLGEVWQGWRGGLAWHGGRLGGALAARGFCRHRTISVFRLGDLLAPGLVVGQAVGRFGNYFNQELFGLPTNLPWGIPIAANNRPAEFTQFTHFHPTFLYESLGLLLIAWLLCRYGKATWPAGRTLALYLLATGILRFLLEFVRIDEQLTVAAVRVGFITAGLVVLIGALVWFRSSRARVPIQA